MNTTDRPHPATTPPSVRQRYTGCLLGGGVGDALGAPVEFFDRATILVGFGPGGIQDLVPAYGRLGAITDDTQMSLFTAEGLLRAYVRGILKGTTSYTSVTAHAYLRWLHTQDDEAKHLPLQELDGWLIHENELYDRRGPGNTCLTALAAMEELGAPAQNNSKGCGGVMRVAPVGLYAASLMRNGDMDLDRCFEMAAEIAAITHGHPTGQLAAGTLAVMVAELVRGVGLREASTRAKAVLVTHHHHEETLAALEHAEDLAESHPNDPEALGDLGRGWVADEALAIALYCALSAPDFTSAVILAVNHDGDSDSTGAIAGNLAGALYGEHAIPLAWREALELRISIEVLADDLYDFRDWPLSTFGNEETTDYYWARYPGH